ncbi:MAG: XdhC family protein [Chloroflexi bacterium]|nr:XdhC family protein [Chloroflexota bacterium]
MGIYSSLAELESKGQPVALAIVIKARGSVPRHARSKMLIYPDGSVEGTIGGGEMEGLVIKNALQALSDGKSRLLHYNFRDPVAGDPGVCGGEIDVYVEPIQPKPTLVVFGIGHVGQAVVHLAHWAGFRVIAADDREEFATLEKAPEAIRVLHCSLAQLPEEIDISDQTYVVLTTRNVEIDVEGLPALVDTPAAYLGVIGSRRRWETAAARLVEAGFSEEKIRRIKSPMGLEINAETPEEIALSILSEIIMLRRGGSGEEMAHDPVNLGKIKHDPSTFVNSED